MGPVMKRHRHPVAMEGTLEFSIESLLQVFASAPTPLRAVFSVAGQWIGTICLYDGKMLRCVCLDPSLGDESAFVRLVRGLMGAGPDVAFQAFGLSSLTAAHGVNLAGLLLDADATPTLTGTGRFPFSDGSEVTETRVLRFEFNPNPAGVLMMEAASAYFAGKSERAEMLLEEAEALDPDDPRARRNLEYVKGRREPRRQPAAYAG